MALSFLHSVLVKLFQKYAHRHKNVIRRQSISRRYDVKSKLFIFNYQTVTAMKTSFACATFNIVLFLATTIFSYSDLTKWCVCVCVFKFFFLQNHYYFNIIVTILFIFTTIFNNLLLFLLLLLTRSFFQKKKKKKGSFILKFLVFFYLILNDHIFRIIHNQINWNGVFIHISQNT